MDCGVMGTGDSFMVLANCHLEGVRTRKASPPSRKQSPARGDEELGPGVQEIGIVPDASPPQLILG
ncbi:MAG TPA: hypothetical protein VFE93_16230 [Myxococcaceae bacterium]|nr:hypothetical protein [Myxococcaceae bacterium]